MATQNCTIRRTDNAPIGKGESGVLKHYGSRTVELTAAASADLIDFKLQIPSNLRISSLSRVLHDDLATSGSPTIDIGLYAVDGNITSDDDALNDGLVVSAVMTASTQTIGVPLVKDFANSGKPAYLFVNGQTTDPGGMLAVKGVVRDAATNATGTITLELVGYLD